MSCCEPCATTPSEDVNIHWIESLVRSDGRGIGVLDFGTSVSVSIAQLRMLVTFRGRRRGRGNLGRRLCRKLTLLLVQKIGQATKQWGRIVESAVGAYMSGCSLLKRI